MGTKEERVIITHDSDFGTLVFREKVEFTGIIYLRPGHFLTSFTQRTIDVILKADLKLKIPFILVAENKGNSVKMRVRLF